MGKQIENSCRDADAYQNRIILEIIAHATNCHQLISTLLEFKLLSHVYIAITARAGTRDSMGAYLHKSTNKKKTDKINFP